MAFADSGSISKIVIAIKPFTNEPFIILRFFIMPIQSYVAPSLDTRIMGYKKITIHITTMKRVFFDFYRLQKLFFYGVYNTNICSIIQVAIM